MLKALWLLLFSLFGGLFATTESGSGAGAGTSATDAAQNNTSGAGGQGTNDPTEIKKLHDEAARYRNEAKTAKELAAQREKETADALGKLTATESQYQVREALLMAAARAKFNDPADVLKYVDVAAILKLEADKREGAISEALTKLATEKAYLVQASGDKDKDKGGGAAANPSPANPAGSVPITLDALKSMTREQIAAHKDEVFALLADKK